MLTYTHANKLTCTDTHTLLYINFSDKATDPDKVFGIDGVLVFRSNLNDGVRWDTWILRVLTSIFCVKYLTLYECTPVVERRVPPFSVGASVCLFLDAVHTLPPPPSIIYQVGKQKNYNLNIAVMNLKKSEILFFCFLFSSNAFNMWFWAFLVYFYHFFYSYLLCRWSYWVFVACFICQAVWKGQSSLLRIGQSMTTCMASLLGLLAKIKV